MNSGATFPALEVSHPKPVAIFNGLAKNAGCNPTSANVLACLRKVDYNTFLAAQNSQIPPSAAISLSYLARPDPASSFFPISPEQAVALGQFVSLLDRTVQP